MEIREGSKNAGGSQLTAGRCSHRQGTKCNKVDEETPEGIRKTPPTNFPPPNRVGDVSMQVKVPHERKRPLLVRHAAGVAIVIIWI